jgi:hypothetical protein
MMPVVYVKLLTSQQLLLSFITKMFFDHTCNPSYSGGTDQEDYSLKPALANSSWDTILKRKKSQKRADGVVQDVGPEFKPQYRKKKDVLWDQTPDLIHGRVGDAEALHQSQMDLFILNVESLPQRTWVRGQNEEARQLHILFSTFSLSFFLQVWPCYFTWND